MDASLLDAVRKSPLFARLADEDLDCIRGGEVISLPAGAVMIEEDTKAEHFYVNLEGEAHITRIYDKQAVLLAVSKPGMYFGEVPLLLDIPWHATVRTTKPSRFYRLDREHFWRMLTGCRAVTTEIFRTASSRLRNLEGYSQHRDRLASLGTMAAGLAHELNNPAAAAGRAAAQLREAVDTVQSYLCQLSKVLTKAEWQDLLTAEQEATKRLENTPQLDSLSRSDREEALAGWLEQHGIAEGWSLAPNLINAGLEVDWLKALAGKLSTQSHEAALRWLEARLNLHLLLKSVEQSSRRVSELVKAMKAYSYVDRSPMQEIDVHEGIENTLMILAHKLKNVTLRRAYDRSAPRIMANGSELNQVWTNLIDNAIDAVNGTGRICIGTFQEGEQLVVEIVDNGSGIPLEIQSRIFEPFFTTKGVGSGTGLGLMLSNRIVADRHGGEIEFETKPGETRFKVRLPLKQNGHGRSAG